MKTDQTFLDRAFERLAGVTDWEEMYGGRNTAGKICQVCPQSVECGGGTEKRCWGKTMIGVMAARTITQGPVFQMTFADLLRESIKDVAKSKERVEASAKEKSSQPTDTAAPVGP
jgi:hypothetical protein